MLEQPIFQIADPERVSELVRDYTWATIVTQVPEKGLVVSHLPIIVESTEPLTIAGHLARTDGLAHELGEHDVVIIVQGPHGYLSPSWYGEEPHVPTWNFVVAHFHGRPEITAAEDTYEILSNTVDHLESRMSPAWKLNAVAGYAQRIAGGTVGFRLRPARTVAKAKLSQDESAELVINSAAQLLADQPYRQPALAAEMLRYLGDKAGTTG